MAERKRHEITLTPLERDVVETVIEHVRWDDFADCKDVLGTKRNMDAAQRVFNKVQRSLNAKA